VQANPTQIHQIVLNLCVNARDAMLPRGGTLRLHAENCRLDEPAARAITGARPGSFLVIEIADTGTGIAPDVLAHIWDPFFTTKPKGHGTGLGLSTVRGVVAGHAGFLALETAIGRGTTFRVFLPAVTHAISEVGRDAPRQAPRGQGELILLVDDEAPIREIAAALLVRQGYRVIVGCDGVEAIGLFTQHSTEICLVVTDLNMPNLDGAALSLVLKRLRPDVPILAMTGLGSSQPAGSARIADFANAKLQKPFTTEALLGAVNGLLHPATPP
jgi:two-component system, cell cycle sensor histidine kinase and response regulator CckA